MSKFSDIFKIGSAIGKQFLPPAGGTILDVVNEQLEKNAPSNAADAVVALAKNDHDQDVAILALHERLKALESK